MSLSDGIKRKQEEAYFEAARQAENCWENIDETYQKFPHETEIVSTMALVAIAAELRAARKSRY